MTDRIAFSGLISADGRRLKGSVQLAGTRTFRNNEWVQVDPAALVRANAEDVMGRIDHDPGKVFARTKNGSLSITRTDQGISWESAELPNTSYANDALELARQGLLAGSSFEIDGTRSSFSTDPDGTRVRTINSIKRLVDVSPVFDPAFPSSAAAFSKESEMPDPETPVVEPKAPPAAPAEPVKFSKPEGDPDAESFAKVAKRQTTEALEIGMDNFAKLGDLDNPQYKAFAAEYDARQEATAEAKARAERLKFEHAARRGQLKRAPEGEVFASDDYKEAFTRYLRTGEKAIMEQFSGQSIAGDGTQGGYMVPASFLQRITETKKAFGGIQRIADSIDTGDGRDLPWPTNDDTANSAAVATEGAAVGSGGADLVLGQVSLGAFTYDATGASNLPLVVSKELLQDAAFDVEAFVGRKLGERLGRKMAAAYATGSGSGEPFGLFTKSADVMSATTMYAALVEHLFQVDQAYRDSGNCRWVFGDTVWSIVYNSLDTTNRPLFQQMDSSGGQAGPQGLLLGFPVTLDQGSGSNVAFGDMRAGFIIRNVKGITVDVDPYSNIKTRQIAFHAWARTDSAVQDSAAYSVSSYSGVSADT